MKDGIEKQVSALVALALVVVVAALLRGAVTESAAAGADRAVAPSWAARVESGLDHVAPEELVDLVLEDPSQVGIVDLRPADEFAALHLAGSVNLGLPQLLGPEGERLLSAWNGRTVVLVSNGMTHPAQAWTEFARRGRRDVRVLEDGLAGLSERELRPPTLRGVTGEHEARHARYRWLAARRALLGDGPSVPAHERYATDPERLEQPTLVSPRWLAARLDAVAVLDARSSAEAFAAGRLPGAQHVPVGRTRTTVAGVADELLPAPDMARLLADLGLTPETAVVVYAEDRPQDATHLLVALLSVGHTRVALLEGGLPAWVASGRALSTAPAPRAPAQYVPRPAPAGLAVLIDEVAQASAQGSSPIVDVRPRKSFRGEESTEARAGHIPGAVNREYALDTVSVDGALYWKPRAELLAAYQGLGVEPASAPIVSCRTGHQASQTWFTLRYLLGWERARWYDGSWKEWAARADLPAATGPGGA
ncbi:MAG: hypothetical protein JNK02_08650 [Planctomycetes bacterium]|nr:hypothetical protein [Planctomycetota bacterium]